MKKEKTFEEFVKNKTLKFVNWSGTDQFTGNFKGIETLNEYLVAVIKGYDGIWVTTYQEIIDILNQNLILGLLKVGDKIQITKDTKDDKLTFNISIKN